MILVAGLAVAGLAGIAAAFYFSMRPGGSRVRAAGPGRAADSRVPASRSRTSPSYSGRSDLSASPERSARPDRPARSDRPARAAASAGPVGSAGSGSGRAAERTGASTVIDFTGPQPVLDDSEPAVTGRRARHGDRLDDTPDTSVTSVMPVPAAGPQLGTSRRPTRTRPTTRSRRPGHVGAWAGVRDPTSTRNCGRPSRSAASPTSSSGTTWPPTSHWPRPRAPLSRRPPPGGGHRTRARCRTCTRSGAGAARTAGTSRPRARARIRSLASARTTGPRSSRPFRPLPSLVQPLRLRRSPTRPRHSHRRSPPSRFVRPSRFVYHLLAQPPAGSRGRSRPAISADEDPLTSPAYSLRAKGSVDGRSRLPDRGREQYNAAVAQDTQAFSLADTQAASGGYPDRVPPFRQVDRPAHSANGRGRPDGYRSDAVRSDAVRSDPLRTDPLRTDPLRSDHLRPDPFRSGDGYGATGAYPYPQPQPYGEPTSSASTPPYGERYGYGAPASQPNPAGDPRRPSGGRIPARAQTAPVTQAGARLRGIRRSTATAGPTTRGATTAG